MFLFSFSLRVLFSFLVAIGRSGLGSEDRTMVMDLMHIAGALRALRKLSRALH